jgi:hypothetical protein
LALVCLAWACASAQVSKSELSGFVRDESGAAVSGARLLARHLDNGFTLSALSRPDGAFEFLGLTPGAYTLHVHRDGFRPLQRENLLLRVNDRLTLDLVLPLELVQEALLVAAEVPLLQSERGSVSFSLDQKRVVSLPLDGRNFVPLIALAPGVNLPPGVLFPRINGSRPRVSEYIYDGVSVLQPEPGQVAYYPVIDAIEEFRVETNSYSAEYGRSNGGVILVNQKSGTNQWRGSLFEFFRHESLNARNLFAAPGPKPLFRRNQYGFVLGGPLQKNKTFFFADWQGSRQRTGVVRLSNVPTAAEAAGIFRLPVFDPATTRRPDSAWLRDPFPANAIPPSRWDPRAAALLARYPLPTSPATANNFRRSGNESVAADQFDLRLDRHFRDRHRVFSRYSFLRDDSRPATPLPDGSGNLTTAIIGNTLTRANSLIGEHTLSFGPARVNQFRLGFTQRKFTRDPAGFDGPFPIYDLVGYQQLGPPANSVSRFATSVTQILDHFAAVRGSHSLKLGVDLRFQTLNVLQPASPAGNFQFTPIFTAALLPSGAVAPNTGNSLASFLTGQVTRYQIDVQPESLRPRATIAEAFLQDDWRLHRRLTLNLGLRYTLNFPSTVVGDRGAVFDLDSQRLRFLGRDGFPRSARDLEKLNFAPRAGLAWKLREDFVLRAAYGLTWIEQAGITSPFTIPLFPFIRTVGEQTLDNLRPAFLLSAGPNVRPPDIGPDSGLGQGVFAVQRNNGSGYAQQWNLSLQKTFGAHWSLEAGYLASKLTRIGVPDVNLNQLTVEQLRLGAQLSQQVPNPFFGQLPPGSALAAPTVPRAQLLRPYPRFTNVALYRNNIGHSTYHSLQARLERRFAAAPWGGLTFTANYTFSRLIDDAGAVFDSAVLTGPVAAFQAADSFNKRLEKDVSTGDVPHIFSSGFVYELPWAKGWQIAGLARLQSGSPIAVTQATNLNAFAGFGIQRPDRLADPALPPDSRSTSRWFNTAAFASAPQFALGNSSRNPVRGPGYRTLDLMLGKTFTLRENLKLEFRAEAFNSFNTPPLGNPNGALGNPAFGAITSALDPRVFELVLKLHF